MNKLELWKLTEHLFQCFRVKSAIPIGGGSPKKVEESEKDK